MEAISRITSKYQATIPAEVRTALGIKKGDAVKFEIEKGKVTLSKATPVDLAFARSLEGTLSEWHSDADEEAYRGL
jgi:antitoxin PrlF